jgi:hypothetical protein
MLEAVSRKQIVEGLPTLGLEGRPVCVHSSLSSFTDVDGGADALGDPIRRTTRVGTSAWSSFPAGEAGPLTAAAIRENPDITHCGDPACMGCNDAKRGSPISSTAAETR